MQKSKDEFFNLIKEHIDNNRFHISVVQTSENPRFAYTIGNLESLGFELIIAGNVNYLYEDVVKIFNSIVPKLNKEIKFEEFSVEVEDLGKFRLGRVHKSWSELMMLGVYDYYKVENFYSFQILPDNNHYTLDIPDMSKEWNADNIIWKWLDDNIHWDLKVPRDSEVITEISVLQGEKVTEVTRWEENEWEAFTQSADDINKTDLRVVPISTLLGIDESLEAILKLNIEDGIWREDRDSAWKNWI